MNEIVIINPITQQLKESVNRSTKKLDIAVPFMSSFALSIFSEANTKKISEKRLVTRFDDNSINSFDLSTLKSLLDYGFEIRYNNNIHLKLYITDSDAFVSSSNLTKGGFEDNVELTIKVDTANTPTCQEIFNEIWDLCRADKVTKDLIAANWSKYEFLKKREQFGKIRNKNIISSQLPVGDLDVQQIIDEIFIQKKQFSQRLEFEFEANKIREQKKEQLRKGYKSELFYVPEGHKMRKESLFYDFAYGYESLLAGTGLREFQFKSVFEHPDFERAAQYFFPEMIGKNPWNLQDKKVLLEFCTGIFDFEIPQYSESIPIRLASYFYPEVFIPIFKLEHLKKICEILGLDTNAKTNGDRLYVYTTFLSEKMKSIPYGNQIKMIFSYNTLYTIELYNRLKKGENFDFILNDYKEVWKKTMVKEGFELLKKLKVS